MIRADITSYLADYRGVFGWNAYTEVFTNAHVPQIEIPLYIKESSIPIRKPKTTEVSTIQIFDPGSQKEMSTNVVFFGSPDILQAQISGWTITPIVNSVWAPAAKDGTPLNWGNLSYNDIIGYFIEGRLNRNLIGAWQRKDPDYYITPRGQVYSSPVIANFQSSATVSMKKQAFDITLFLET